MLKTIEQSVRGYVEMPDDIARHANAALYDLYFGPYSPDHWREESDCESEPDYSFAYSTAIFFDWLDDIGTLYVEEESACVSTSEPMGEYYTAKTDAYSDTPCDHFDSEYIEPMPYYVMESRDIADALGYGQLCGYR